MPTTGCGHGRAIPRARARSSASLASAARRASRFSFMTKEPLIGTPSTIITTEWRSADGENHLIIETLAVRRRSDIVSAGYLYSHGPETIYFNGDGIEINRILRSLDGTPVTASADGGRTWEPYRDEDGDGRHDRQSEAAYQPANAPSGGGTSDSAGNSGSSGTASNTNPSGGSSSNSNDRSSDKPDSSSSGDKPDTGGSSSSGDKPETAEKTDKPGKEKSQPVEGTASNRDYFGEMGVTHPGGRPKHTARGSDDRNIPDPSGIVIQRDPAPTPEELKAAVTQPGLGDAQRTGGGGHGGRNASDFAQPPAGPSSGVNSTNPGLGGSGAPGSGGGLVIPDPSGPAQ